ncbi:hypothetical protein [Pelagicoccus sp. SDUM812003]|uniref:hypothetical protein n=1 Tax=Pelagicoccus sp. SDUM812003 TaxID=3041267 RepID=UPI00280D50B6|nr:hypothetical protein [Pelagicoccus sp. SDUM812003]MDQ8205837.1 hypothetical protein [Pelagicoccus sp. SDUM812003]
MRIPLSDIEQFLSDIKPSGFQYDEDSFEIEHMGTIAMFWNDRGLISASLSTPKINSFYLASCVGKEIGVSLHDGAVELRTLFSVLDFINVHHREIIKMLESEGYKDTYLKSCGLAPIQK